MARPDLLILRPQPGAERTRAQAAAMGLDALVAPIFQIVPIAWDPPPAAAYQAVVITSPQAPRLAGTALAAYRTLRCYAVGDASAEAARQAGFTDIRTGPSDALALTAMMRGEGVGKTLHLCGREHLAFEYDGIDRRIVYGADALPALSAEALAALRSGSVTMIHSPRAGRHFATLVAEAGLDRAAIPVAAISKAAATAAGPGWHAVAVALAPRDQPLLELAAKLCKEARQKEQR